MADSAVIKAYNTQNARTYLVLPSNLYSLPNTKLVIPKGKREVSFPINFVNADQLFNKNYVLALTIKSTSHGLISGNFGTMLYLISGINRYDGVYLLKYRFGANDRGYDLNAITWYYSEVHLFTTGATTNTLRNLNVGSPYVHPAVGNGIPTSIASFTPQFTFDLSNDKITGVSNTVTGTKTVVLNPAVTDNRAEPGKAVYASFILKEAGKQDMIINDTLLYQKPR